MDPVSPPPLNMLHSKKLMFVSLGLMLPIHRSRYLLDRAFLVFEVETETRADIESDFLEAPAKSG